MQRDERSFPVAISRTTTYRDCLSARPNRIIVRNELVVEVCSQTTNEGAFVALSSSPHRCRHHHRSTDVTPSRTTKAHP